jgi:hypothetical protein
VTGNEAFVRYTLVTTFVEVAFGYGVMSVVIDVKFTSFVLYVTFVTGHHASLTVSWITKQQFVTSGLVVGDGGDIVKGVLISGAIYGQLSKFVGKAVDVLGEVEFA